MRNRIRRRVTVVAAMFAATVLAFPSPAMAADNMPGRPPSSCPGYLLSGFPITKHYDGSGILRLYVYYSSANGGTNCAILRTGGAWYGSGGDLRVEIWKSANARGNDAPWPDAAWDDGNYRYYAGAVYITGTNGKCISVVGSALEYEPMKKYRFACG
jgi:hypothetical protein